MKKQVEQEKGRLGGVPHIVGTVIGIALIVVLLPIMIINMTLIIKSYTRPSEVPSVFGVYPLIVESGSMEKEILIDDLILAKTVDANTLKVGDIIAFRPMTDSEIDVSKKVVTHRIKEVLEEDGRVTFVTKGDANNAPDADKVEKTQVIGIYFQRFGKVGKVANFLKEPVGMVLCVVVPLALFLLYDILRRFFYNRQKKQEVDADREELERLRALAASLEQPAAPPEGTADPAPEETADIPPEAENPPEEAAAQPEKPAYPPVEGEGFEDEA